MIASLIASVLAVSSTEFSNDPEQHSVWMQQACRIQQVGHAGGVPDNHTAFCACSARAIRAEASAPVYRISALGAQGSIQDQAMVDDWAAARDAAATEAAALPPEERARFQPVLQAALGACLPHVFQGEQGGK